MIRAMLEKCPLCGRARAVRDCPALGHRLCSLCCGRGRGRTIDCPAACRYFQQGRERALLRLVELAGDRELETDFFDVVHNLRLVLVRARRDRGPDLTAEVTAEALENAAATVRTRSRGVIYEFRSHDPRVQLLGDELLRVAEGHRGGEGGFRRVEATEVVRCIEYIRHQVKAAGQRGIDHFELAGQVVGRDFVTVPGGPVPAGRPGMIVDPGGGRRG